MADDNRFAVQVLAPERVLVTGRASQVVMRTEDGEIAFLDGHTPLVGSLVPCVVRVVRSDEDEDRLAVHGGFVQVEQRSAGESEGADDEAEAGTRVTVLASVAELADEIDTERARRALEAAEAAVAERTASSRGAAEGDDADVGLAEANAALRRAQVRLEAAGSGDLAGA